MAILFVGFVGESGGGGAVASQHQHHAAPRCIKFYCRGSAARATTRVASSDCRTWCHVPRLRRFAAHACKSAWDTNPSGSLRATRIATPWVPLPVRAPAGIGDDDAPSWPRRRAWSHCQPPTLADCSNSICGWVTTRACARSAKREAVPRTALARHVGAMCRGHVEGVRGCAAPRAGAESPAQDGLGPQG